MKPVAASCFPRAGRPASSFLFSESAGRVLVAVPRTEESRFRSMCEARGLPATRIGVVGPGQRRRRGAGPVHGVTGGAAQHVGGRAARVVRVSAADDITGEPVAAATSAAAPSSRLGVEPGAPRLRRHRVRRAVLLPVADAVAAAAGLAVPGADRRHQRGHRLRHRRVRPEDAAPLRVTATARGGRRRSGCSTWCKAATVALSIGASVLMLIPAAAWQRQVSAVMGIEGPDTLGYLRTLVVAVLVGGRCAWRGAGAHRRSSRRWPGSSSGAGTCTTRWRCSSAPRSSWCWRSRLVNGVLVRGFLAGANRVFQPQNTTTRAGDRPAAASPNDPAAQRRSRRGTRWATRAATSSPPDRTPTS